MVNKIHLNPTVPQEIQTQLICLGRDDWAELNQCQLASIPKKILIDENRKPNDPISYAFLKLQILEFSEIFFREKEKQYLVVCHVKSKSDLDNILELSQNIGWEVTSCPNPKAGWHHPNKYMCVILSHPNTWVEWLDIQYPGINIDEDEFNV